MSVTFEKAEALAAAAVQWALLQLSDDPRLSPLARVEAGMPLHVLARQTLVFVEEHLESGVSTAPGDGPDDRNPSRAQLLKVRAALGFAYARALDAALAQPETAVAEAGAAPYFEPQLRSAVSHDLEQLVELLGEATSKLANVERLAAANARHVDAGIDSPKHRDWLRQQEAQLLQFGADLRAVGASAQDLTMDLTFDGARRRALPYASLHGLSRREQQRTLTADALLLHEEFDLSETEIGAIWHGNPPDRDEAKRLGGKVLAQARRARSRAPGLASEEGAVGSQ